MMARAYLVCLATLALARTATALPPTVDAPPALRPCCMLGVDAPLRIGPLSTPLRIANVVPWDRLGVHRYGRRSSFDERNGLTYSCDHGLLDVGHLRNAADWTGYLARELGPLLGRAGSRTFRIDDGRMHVELFPVPDAFDRSDVAQRVAQRLAYDLAVWHEVATAAGYAPAPMVPDSASAFSPEDLHSDLLGALLGGAAVASPEPFDAAMTRLIASRLAESQSADTDGTRAVLRALDGTWWDSRTRHIDPRFVTRRRYDVALPLAAWRPVDGDCPNPPRSMMLPGDGADGIPLSRFYQASIEPPAQTHARLGLSPNASVSTDQLAALAARLASRDAAGDPPGSATPQQMRWLDYRYDEAADYQGFRLGQLAVFGGGRGRVGARGLGGGEIIGGAVESYGGDIETMHLTGAWVPPHRGFVTRVVGARARALYVCRDRANGKLHGPVLAWFENCEEDGWFGVGGSIAEIQHDSDTGRLVTRPLALHGAINLLGNAFSHDYLRRRLVLSGGLGVETFTPGTSQATTRGRTSPKLDVELSGTWRSHSLRWEAELFSAVTQNLTDRGDYGLEAGARLTHRWVLGDPGEAADGYLIVALEGAMSHWQSPQRSLARWALPLLSARVPRSAYLLARIGFAWERFTL